LKILFLNGGNSTQKQTFGYIINIYFKLSKTLVNVYDDLKNCA
jgi:hypothetical protein